MLSDITIEVPYFLGQEQDSLNIVRNQQVRRQRVSEKIELIEPIHSKGVSYMTEIRNELVLPEKVNVRQTTDWEIGIFIVSLLLLVFVRLFHSSYLRLISEAAINLNAATRMFREKSLSRIQASMQMEVLFYIVFSLFIYQFLEVIHIHIHPIPIVEYLIICVGVIGFFLAKRALYILQGNICKSFTETKEYLFHMNIYNQILTVLLFPISIVISFSKLSDLYLPVFVGIFLICVSYLFVVMRGIKILMQKRFSIFYLILYLCTLEILPLLYVYKMVAG